VTTVFESVHAGNERYESEIQSWRQQVKDQFREANGWLTLIGLCWLHEGENTIGSDLIRDVLLLESAPQRVGMIDFHMIG